MVNRQSELFVVNNSLLVSRVDNRFTQYPIRRSKASLTQEEKQLDLNLSCFFMTNLVFLDIKYKDW